MRDVQQSVVGSIRPGATVGRGRGSEAPPDATGPLPRRRPGADLLFNSWAFVVFFVAVYTLYLLARNYRQQNVLLLLASYYFYAAWNWRFLFLLLGSTVLDYVCALKIDLSASPTVRKRFLLVSLVGNLTLLGFFKYFNFFLDSLQPLVLRLGVTVEQLHLDIVLPVGISFYTFQEMSYTIDVYRREIRATRRFLDFALFVAFFPHMVAGPIMRASALLTQFFRPRTVTSQGFVSGCWLILWGLWKKIVIADNMALLADPIFRDSASTSWLLAYLAVIAFAVQIYADFSAYSDIARGVSRLLGIELMQNFNLPYFAVNPSDFWKRWHISLSTWLKDYLYVPLGGNRGTPPKTYRNLLLTMALGGLWHGAAWNYVWWGLYHGALLAGHRLWRTARPARALAGWRVGVQTLLMFQLTLFGWLLFRCTRRIEAQGRMVDDSFRQMVEMMTSFTNGSGFDAASLWLAATILAFCLPLLAVEMVQYRSGDQFFMLKLPVPAQAALVASLIFTWLMWGIQAGTAFIYFQF
jgi:alginate O-acetyltransferase complex protein AlgI